MKAQKISDSPFMQLGKSELEPRYFISSSEHGLSLVL